MAEKVLMLNPGPELGGDLQGPVRGSRIDDHNLARQPLRAAETAGQIGLLIVGNDGDRDGEGEIGHVAVGQGGTLERRKGGGKLESAVDSATQRTEKFITSLARLGWAF